MICAECETVAHCAISGCIPAVERGDWGVTYVDFLGRRAWASAGLIEADARRMAERLAGVWRGARAEPFPQ